MMRRLSVFTVAAAALLLYSASACGSDSPPDGTIDSEPPENSETSPEATVGSGFPEREFEVLDHSNFDRSTTIDNEWFPLHPGTQFVYEGSANEDGERVPRGVVFTVTDLTKVIDGVRAVVVWDRDYNDGELVEAELAFFAQDNDGNVWLLGEYTEIWDGDEQFDGGLTWLAGLEGSRAGIFMKAEPLVGTPSHSQGYAPPPINWTDRAEVYRVDQETCVPVDCYDDILVTQEFSWEEPEAYQLKYYAPAVGNVRVDWRGEREEERERLELVDLVQLSPEALAEVRTEALELEKRAYGVYGHTVPAGSEPPENEGTSPEATVGSGLPEGESENLDHSNFDRSTSIDNEWFPLHPGTQFVYEGSANEDGERVPRSVVFTVTDLTKVIDGVRAVVVWERDFSDGELVEAELAFFAQDNDGDIWFLGEYTEIWDGNEQFDGGLAWLAGLEGSRPGLFMKAEPQLGTPSYSEGYAPPPINWADRAQVYRVGEETCVPVACYDDSLVIQEFSEDEPEAFQLKFYARGVGNVEVDWRGEGEEEQERLELVDLVQLSPEALAEVRTEALVLEKRAYGVYSQTTPAEPLLLARLQPGLRNWQLIDSAPHCATLNPGVAGANFTAHSTAVPYRSWSSRSVPPERRGVEVGDALSLAPVSDA